MVTDSSQGALKLLDGGNVGEFASQARKQVAVTLKNSDHVRLLVNDIPDL